MSAKTCLLCGKPLSRIWVGSGEDFCSREHRNQYRLRKGMDRLSEANQLATIMRRRENLKPVPVPGSNGEAAIERQAFGWKTPATGATHAMRLGARVLLTSLRLPHGGVAKVPATSVTAAARELAVSPRSNSKVVTITARRPLRLHAAALQRAANPVALPETPRRGLELRVSMGAGFRIRAPLVRAIHVSSPETMLHGKPRAPGRTRPADMFHEPLEIAAARPFAERPPALPGRPVLRAQASMTWPGAKPLYLSRSNRHFDPRPAGNEWNPVSPLLLPRKLRPAGLPEPPAARIFAVATPPAVYNPELRTTAVPFTPAETPFGRNHEEPLHS